MRRTFTAKEKASVFELWKNGTGFSEIANILGSKLGTIFTMLRDTSGIKPNERKRAVAHLTPVSVKVVALWLIFSSASRVWLSQSAKKSLSYDGCENDSRISGVISLVYCCISPSARYEY